MKLANRTFAVRLIQIGIALGVAIAGKPAFGEGSSQHVSDACTTNERWELHGRSSKWIDGFYSFLSGENTPIYGFSEALQLKRLSQIMSHSEFESDFSEYWVARVLFQLKMDFLAHQAFTSVLENSEVPELKKAAFICEGEIQKRTPDLKVPNQIPFAVSGEKDASAAADAIFLTLLQNLGSNSKVVSLLPAAHQELILGMAKMQQKKYLDAAAHLEKFVHRFDQGSISPSHFLSTFLDQARIFLGRAYYSIGKFPESEQQFQLVTKTSNLEIDALSDLSWAYLQADRFDDVLGIAMQLRVGSLHNTFAPEPTMVAAMALNERCQFPDSVKMISAFVKDYGTTYQWLSSHKSGNPDLYSEIVKVMKKDNANKTEVPGKVASEWLKSPEYLTRQMELNVLIAHPKDLAEIQAQAYDEQLRLTQLTIHELTTFTSDVKLAKNRLKDGVDLSDEYAQRYSVLKKKIRKLARYYKSSRTWKSFAKNYQKRIPQLRADLVKRINRDLQNHDQLLLSQLDKIRDNMDLIEVEIYNGASHDMIWKNAHPDFEKVSQKIQDQKESPGNAQVWTWGRYVASELEDVEVWEDEMGALKADVSDQCHKKEKYLALKMKKH